MKKTVISLLCSVMVAVIAPSAAHALDIKDLLGGSGVGGTVGNLIEGVFTKTNLEVKDMVGEWTVDGSAVTFKSDNMLKKAGGVAAAAALEAKLDPYYKQYGLTGGVMTINNDSTFTFKVKKMTMSGTISKNSDGTFAFKFKAFNKISLGSIKTYVQKSGNTLEIMFDANKLKSIVSSVAGISGISIAKTVGSVLDGYDGLCVGFGTTKTGNASKSTTATTESSTSTQATKSSGEKSTDKKSNAGDDLKSKAAEALGKILGK